MQKRTFLTDATSQSIDAPVPIRGLIIINATDKDCIVIADNGDTFPCPALVISTWSLPPTLRVSAKLTAAPTNGKSCNVIVTDDLTANSTSQLATLSGGLTPVQFAHNDVLIGTEPQLDFEDNGLLWGLSDDPPNARVKVTAELMNQFNMVGPFGATADLVWPGGRRHDILLYLSGANVGDGIRSITAPGFFAGFNGAGTKVTIRNGGVNPIRFFHNGGVAPSLFNPSGQDFILASSQLLEYIYDGGNWVLSSYTQAFPRIETGRATFATGATAVTFARQFVGLAPTVVITGESGVGVAPAIAINTPPTLTGFILQNGSGGNMNIGWTAVGT